MRTEILPREVSVPDQPHKEVTFSSKAFGASTVTIDFTRWVDMGYPNQVVVTVSPAPRAPKEFRQGES